MRINDMTKPFYKRDSFVPFVLAPLFLVVAVALVVDAILSNNYGFGMFWIGLFFGMGEGYILAGGGFRNFEKKLDEAEKKLEATISLLNRQRNS
jgi:hypothetical protein